MRRAKKNATFSQLDISRLNFITRSCDLCGNKRHLKLYSVPFLGLEFNFVRCTECGLVYQNPPISQESLNHIYETSEYWDHKNICSPSSTMLNYYSYLDETQLRERTAKIRIKWISHYLKKKSRILDLGCSDGLFVHSLSKSGFIASGIDVSSVMVKYGRETLGVDLRLSDFEEDWPFSESFDAIVCFATLSNMVNPSKVFNNVRRHLRPGGYFFFNFGCRDRLISRILGSRLYLYRPTVATIYSKKTVESYCRNSDLRIREIFTDIQIVPLARLIGFFRVSGFLWILNRLGLEETKMRMPLLTGYAACAIHNDRA